MYNRAEIVDENFVKHVQNLNFPKDRCHLQFAQAAVEATDLIDIFESQIISRHLDLQARILKNTNQCFYTIGSSGHEGNAVFGKYFRHTDMAFLHYRCGAFMVQRSKQVPGVTPIYDAMLSFVASSDDPISGGRHKVFGSKVLNIPPQTSTIASQLPKAMGAALSIQRAKELKIASEIPDDGIVLCEFGDASANHSTAQGAINTASWIAYQNIQLPIVFICEDNGIGISVHTPSHWIESSFSNRPGIKYFKADGLNLLDLIIKTKEVEAYVRATRRPAFFHVETVRLLGHAGSDVEFSYHTQERIEAIEFEDPLLHSARILIENNILTKEQIISLYESIRERVAVVGKYATTRPKLLKPEDIRATVTACAFPKQAPAESALSDREKKFGNEFPRLKTPQHLAKLLNYALVDILLKYPQACIFGEDVAQKGGVYNVTDGLHQRFGAKRVFNSLLDEQSILGTAIGFAHNGFLPMPEIQFLAYVHNAEDQIRGEAATLAFFSKGQFTNPMVIRIAGLPYQKGFGGHFHNDNSLAVFRDIPGIIIAVPSNGLDAAKMLRRSVREAYEKGRVIVFVEPIALYMTKDLHQEGDKKWSHVYPEADQEIDIGEFALFPSIESEPCQVEEFLKTASPATDEILILSYANGFYFSRQAQKILLDKHQIKSQVIDLRWVAPLNKERLFAVAKKFKNILIVDECRATGSQSEALVSLIVEGHAKESDSKPSFPQIQVLAAHDCFITLGVAAAAGLPSKDDIINTCLKMVKKANV